MQSLRIPLTILLVLLFFHCWTVSARPETHILTQLVQVRTDDGVWLTGVLRRPDTARSEAGVVMIHGYGGNFYSGVMSFLPQKLAARGIATLAVNMRDHDLGPKKNLFEENRLDIQAAVDEMAQRGFRPLFLYGHSMGTNRVLYYLAATNDPRVIGALLTGPPGNLFRWNVRAFGREAATRVLRQAQDLVASGKGNEWMLIDLGPLGKALYTANHVVSLRGPETRSDPFKNIAHVSKPILIVHGLDDRLADPAVAEKLRQSAGPGREITVTNIAGANHRFRGHEQNLTDAIFRWLLERLHPQEG